MIVAKVVLALALSQGYVRSKVTDGDPSSQCLWWKEGTAIIFHQNVDGNPETPGDSEFLAAQRAFATWQEQMNLCGNLSVSEGERTTSRLVGYDDQATSNENIVVFRVAKCMDRAAATHQCWKDDDCGNQFDCWQHSAGAIAITTTSYNPQTGRILDSDIELNAPSYIFTTVDSPPCIPPDFRTTCVATDVQNTLTHEVGHSLGLSHISTPGSTMNPRADPGETSKRVLDIGSKKYVCDAYPKGLPTKTCVINTFDGNLGKPAGGCASAPGGAVALLALAGLLLRRRR